MQDPMQSLGVDVLDVWLPHDEKTGQLRDLEQRSCAMRDMRMADQVSYPYRDRV